MRFSLPQNPFHEVGLDLGVLGSVFEKVGFRSWSEAHVKTGPAPFPKKDKDVSNLRQKKCLSIIVINIVKVLFNSVPTCK